MTTLASKPSAVDHSLKTGTVKTCAALLLFLVPLAIGALWTAKCGSHGQSSFCIIDPESKHATFIFEGYFGTGADVRCRAFNLESGKQVSDDGIFDSINRMQETYAIRRLGERSYQLYQWDEIPLANEPIEFSVPTSKNTIQVQEFIHGLVLATEHTADSTKILLIEPKTSRVADQVEVARDAGLYKWNKTDYVEVASGGSGANPAYTRVKITGGKIELDSSLRSGHFISPFDESGNSYAITVAAYGKSIEVRSIDGDEPQSSIELSDPLGYIPIISFHSGSSWVSFGPAGGVPVKSIDFLSGADLPVPSGWVLCDRSRTSKITLTTSPGASLFARPGKPEAQLIDEVSGAVIAGIESGRIITSKFTADGEQLLIATADQRIMQLDARTGKVLKLIAPFWYIPYLEILSAMAYFCWCCVWIRCSPAIHRYAWFDCAILTGLCIGYVILRTRMTGFPGDAVRPIYQFAEGIFATWLIMSSLWLVLGRTRFSLRVLPQIGIVGLIILITLACVGFQNPRVWELVIATVLLSAWLVIVLVPLRFMGYRFVRVEQAEKEDPARNLTRGAIPIRDLFLLTTVLAGMFALGRFAPPGLQMTARMVVDLFVLVFAVTFTALAAVRVGLSRRSFSARVLTLLVVAVFGMSLPILWMTIYLGWKALHSPDINFLFWELRLHTSAAVATALCLYAFRVRGWRLVGREMDCLS